MAEERDRRATWFLPPLRKEERKYLKRIQNDTKSCFALRLLPLERDCL